ncbi:hypothetical protein [Rahnella sp. PAMC 25559]|uniref:hypothetical protein n=1 Tax=Rahnella sp. PAMC 25559 TaxID=3423225 RepID=UPI003D66A165
MIKFLLKKETLLVAILTLAGYLVGLLYEVGFSLYFKYPASFISVDIKSIIFGLISVLALLFFITATISVMDSLSRKFKGARALLLYSTIYGGLLIYCGLVYYMLTGSGGIYLYGILIAYIACLLLFFPYGYKKKGITFEEGVKEVVIKMSSQNDSAKSKEKKFFESVLAYSFMSAALGIFVVGVGSHFARMNQSFYTFYLEKTKYAIVGTYGNNLITSKVIDNKISTGVYIYKDSEIKNALLKREKINNDL